MFEIDTRSIKTIIYLLSQQRLNYLKSSEITKAEHKGFNFINAQLNTIPDFFSNIVANF